SVPFIELLLDAGGLTAQLDKDGATVLLVNPKSTEKDQTVGSISAPTVEDAAGLLADFKDVTVGLTDQGDGTYLLSYFVGVEWLGAKERTFPVTLDPSVCIRAGETGCTVNTNVLDIWYGSGSNTPGATGAYASQYVTSSLSDYLHVGRYVATSDPWGQTRAALYFPGVSLADGAVVTSANLQLREAYN